MQEDGEEEKRESRPLARARDHSGKSDEWRTDLDYSRLMAKFREMISTAGKVESVFKSGVNQFTFELPTIVGGVLTKS